MTVHRDSFGVSLAVIVGALAWVQTSAAQCTGDLDGSGVIDGADLGTLLQAWNTADGASDLNQDGSVDGADLGILLRSWGSCLPEPSRFGSTMPIGMVLSTPEGPQSVVGELAIEFDVDPPNDIGVSTVHVRQATFSLSSAPTMGTETGGIDLQLIEGGVTGALTASGDISMPIWFDAHYWLINELHLPTPTTCVEDEAEESSGYTEHEEWYGMLTGTMIAGGDEALVNINFQLGVASSLAKGGVGGAVAGAVATIPKKEYPGLGECNAPKVKTNKRIVCIQPVFIGTGADDATKTGVSFPDMKAKANETWAKCCVELDWKAPKYINKPEFKTIKKKAAGDAYEDFRKLTKEEDPKGENECIEVFFITHMQTSAGKDNADGDGISIGGGTKGVKVVIADDATAACDPKSDGVLAHELGHAMGNCKHPNVKAAAAGTCMVGTGKVPPACPGLNNTNVKTVQCDKVHKGPLVKEKTPKAPCCTDPLG